MKENDKKTAYQEVLNRIERLLNPGTDFVAAMATVVCELHHAFDYYDWTGFYRTIGPGLLQIGPYQGGHGCIDIPFGKGVCGRAASTHATQLVHDVNEFPGHIACSATTLSEIVVPIVSSQGEMMAVLDVDSDRLGAFDEVDREYLELLCARLGRTYGSSG